MKKNKKIVIVLAIILVGILAILISNYLTHKNDCCSCCPEGSDVCIDLCCKCEGAIFK